MVFSLTKLSYIACPKPFQGWYDVTRSKLDIKQCCVNLTHLSADTQDTVCTDAARHGHVECLQVARLRGLDWSVETATAAAAEGRVSALRYLCENGCPLDSGVPEAAATAGHVNVLRYLRARGWELDENTLTAAARHGHVKCMRFCREVANVPWTSRPMIAAAAHGRLESIKYAFANGCEPNDAVCVVAAVNGHFELLKFAHEHGCQLTWAVITMTTDKRIREYCQDRGIERSVNACNSCVMRCREDSLDVLKFLHRNEYPWDETTWRLAATFNPGLLGYLEEHGCPRPSD